MWPQLKNEVEDKDHVVLLFQDMLEVTTKDIMEEQLYRQVI